jgi:DNA-binding beta-propeller fold protein YncE
VGLAATPDGRRVIDAVTNEGFFDTISLSAATGEQQWVAREGTHGTGTPNALTLSPDGSMVFVTGQTDIFNVHPVTYAHEVATGTLMWSRQAAAFGEGLAVRASPTGAFLYVAGTVSSPPDYFLAVYDESTGRQLGFASYDSGGDDELRGLVITPDGRRLILAGSADCFGAGDYLTVAYAASALAS